VRRLTFPKAVFQNTLCWDSRQFRFFSLFDAFAIELQNNPDSQGYIIMYQGTDKTSMRVRKVDVISKRTLDYLVKSRGIDPRRIVITNWGTRPTTVYELWVIPPGAQPPVPQ
jgi:hypothetical protein